MEIGEALRAIKAAKAQGDGAAAFAQLAGIASPDFDFPTQRRMAGLVKGLGPETLRPLKVALLAGSTLDHFAEVLVLWGALRGLAIEIWTAPFDTIEQTVLDPHSGLYAFAPEIAWIFTTHRDVRLAVAPGAEPDQAQATIEAEAAQTASLWQALLDRHPCTILHNTADIPAIDVFGNHETNTAWGRRSLLRGYNLALARLRPPQVVLFDLDHVAALYGKRRWIDARYWHHSKHAFAFDALGLVAHEAAAVLAGIKGLAKKCLVLDLDNTLWGGVIGDDGLAGIRLGGGADGEAFVAIQAYAKALHDRGIILAVCSKNDEANAKAPFQDHPDMRLGLDDIAVFRANWDNKADNIRAIAEILNIGLDSLVFVDDNPAERALVRTFLPMVIVPELPEDPAGYVETIAAGHWFPTITFLAEDARRADMYRDNARRVELQRSFTDTAGYLASLDMVAQIGGADSVRLPRMAQLIAKSNQFHLTGTRHSEATLAAMAADGRHALRWFTLADRFGDNGLISVVVLAKGDDGAAHIDTWVMSCRVLSRGMEEFIANDLAATAIAMGCQSLAGRYVPSKKNSLVAGLYPRLGFTQVGEDADGTTHWCQDLKGRAPLATSIRSGMESSRESGH